VVADSLATIKAEAERQAARSSMGKVR
jgi:hypothetical protein